MRPSRRTTRGAGALAGLLLLVLAAAPSLRCGGASGTGFAIATVGVSLVFAGSSPGFALRDPSFDSTASSEPEFVMNPGDTIDRVQFLSGELESDIDIVGELTSLSGTATMTFTAYLLRADDDAATPDLPGEALASASVTVSSSLQAVTTTLAIDPSARPLRAQPGDLLVIRLQCPSANPGPMTVHTGDFRVDSTVRPATSVHLHLTSSGRAATPRLESLGSTSTTTLFTTANVLTYDIVQPGEDGIMYQLAGMSSGATFKPGGLVWRFEGNASYSLRMRSTSTSTPSTVDIELFLGSTSLGRVTQLTAPVGGFARVAGEFPGVPGPIDIAGGESLANPRLRLEVSVLGPPIELESAVDPAQSSVVTVRLANVLADLSASTGTISVLQPPR